jgi:vacuolar-type H+-ATPase subunit C/Vma6
LAEDLTYAVARIRAIEARMPDRAWFLRMARSPARQLLTGVREHYPGFDSVEAPHEFEKGIELDKASLFDLFSSVLGPGPEAEFLMAGCDFDNLVLALKGKMLGAEAVLVPYGLTDTGRISEAVGSEDPVMLPAYLKELYGELAGPAGKGLAAEVDRTGERAKWRFLLGAAPSDDARRYVRFAIDRINIKTFARLQVGSLFAGSGDIWIEGGTIESSRFEALRGEPFEDFLSFLGSTDWRGLAGRGFERSMEPWRIDPALDGTLLELIADSRSRFFDMMPLLYHVELRERNARLIRTIFTGRINGLPEDDIAGSVEALL